MYQQQASATSTWAKQPLCIQVRYTHRFIRITKTLLVSTWQSFSSSDHTFQEIASLDKGYFLETVFLTSSLKYSQLQLRGFWCLLMSLNNWIVPGLVETTILLYNSFGNSFYYMFNYIPQWCLQAIWRIYNNAVVKLAMVSFFSFFKS